MTISSALPVDGAPPSRHSDGKRTACWVTGAAHPVPDSTIGFEVWLPAGWNGRYYQLGNGGFGGSIHAPSLAAEAARGNAAASTDTGHRGDAFDARWATSDIAMVH